MYKSCLSRHCFALALDLKEYSPEAVLKERELALYGICFKNKARVESPSKIYKVSTDWPLWEHCLIALPYCTAADKSG